MGSSNTAHEGRGARWSLRLITLNIVQRRDDDCVCLAVARRLRRAEAVAAAAAVVVVVVVVVETLPLRTRETRSGALALVSYS